MSGLEVVHFAHHEGRGIAPFMFTACYDVDVDGSVLPGDIVVMAQVSQVSGGGNTFFVEYDDGLGPHAILGGQFANLWTPATIFAVPFDGQLVADAATGSINYQVMTPQMLERDTGERLLRFGWRSDSQYIGTAYAAWVLRDVAFNLIPPGSFVATNSTPVGPTPVLYVPVPGAGVLTASQMAFGVTSFLDGGGFMQPAVAVRANWDVGPAFNPLPRFEQWNSAFGQRNFASDVFSAEPGQDLTGMQAIMDSVPTGSTTTGVDIVSTQASAMFGLLDLTDIGLDYVPPRRGGIDPPYDKDGY